MTAGGPEDACREGGYDHFSISDLLKPLRQTANLSGVHYNTPIVSHNMISIPGVYNKEEELEQRAIIHAGKLYQHIGQS